MPPILWECCKCGARPMKVVTTPKCVECNHARDSNCPTDDNIRPPGTKKTTVFQGYYHNIEGLPSPFGQDRVVNSTWENDPITGLAPYPNPVPYGKGVRPSSRPVSVAGWWTCHKCGNMNNPELCAGRCTVCNHTKCHQCRAIRR